MIFIMQDLHLFAEFCSKKMCGLLFLSTHKERDGLSRLRQAGGLGLFPKGEQPLSRSSEALQELL